MIREALCGVAFFGVLVGVVLHEAGVVSRGAVDSLIVISLCVSTVVLLMSTMEMRR